MSALKKLMDAGAACVAGDVILNNVVVARVRDGQEMLTEAGLEQVEALGAAPAKKPNGKKPKAEAPSAPEEGSVDAGDAELDELLG